MFGDIFYFELVEISLLYVREDDNYTYYTANFSNYSLHRC